MVFFPVAGRQYTTSLHNHTLLTFFSGGSQVKSEGKVTDMRQIVTRKQKMVFFCCGETIHHVRSTTTPPAMVMMFRNELMSR